MPVVVVLVRRTAETQHLTVHIETRKLQFHTIRRRLRQSTVFIKGGSRLVFLHMASPETRTRRLMQTWLSRQHGTSLSLPSPGTRTVI